MRKNWKGVGLYVLLILAIGVGAIAFSHQSKQIKTLKGEISVITASQDSMLADSTTYMNFIEGVVQLDQRIDGAYGQLRNVASFIDRYVTQQMSYNRAIDSTKFSIYFPPAQPAEQPVGKPEEKGGSSD